MTFLKIQKNQLKKKKKKPLLAHIVTKNLLRGDFIKLFLAGTHAFPWLFKDIIPLYVLESFYYIQEWQLTEIPKYKMFLLDSGAFTFMNNIKDKSKVDFDEYLTKYIAFINKNNIKYFFELDIDSVVGYEKVKELRKRLERETNKKCIPVWHKSRGLEEFIKLTEEYDYIAIGGIVTKEIKPSEYKYFPKLISIAHKNNCKIHGLGFTSTSKLYKYHFDSVDSTTWLKASRFGRIDFFDGQKIKTYKKPPNSRITDYKKCDDYIFQEWIKFQRYADKHL